MEYEESIRIDEETLLQNNSEVNRFSLQEFKSNYIRYLKLEVSIMKQKRQLRWLKESDTSSKLFNSLIRGRRRKLFIHRINEMGEWVQGDNNIGRHACEYFQHIFTGEDKVINQYPLDCMPRMVSQVHNNSLTNMPCIKVLREVVF